MGIERWMIGRKFKSVSKGKNKKSSLWRNAYERRALTFKPCTIF